MRIFWAFVLLISLLLGAFVARMLPENLRIQKVMTANQRVSVRIINCSEVRTGGAKTYVLRFKYAGETRDMEAGKELWDNCAGNKTIELLHLPDYPDLFIQPDSGVLNALLTQVAIMVMTAAGSVYAVLRLFSANPAFKK